MLPALFATILFAVSSVSGRRNVALLGPAGANFWRQLLALGLLGAYAHSLGQGLNGPGFHWFLLSGFIGYGIGDVGIYLALPRLGSRLTALMTQCLAAPFGALLDWAWHGHAPGLLPAASAAVILLGVALALAPSRQAGARTHVTGAGIAFGVLGALGQAGGAVVSRTGFTVAAAAGQPADPVSVSYQRILAGVLVALSWYLLDWRLDRQRAADGLAAPAPDYRKAWPWIVTNAVAGPTLGVVCYQWALKTAEPSLVLPVVAMTPLAVIPLAMLLEHERPTRRSLAGGFIAVAGVIWLARSTAR